MKYFFNCVACSLGWRHEHPLNDSGHILMIRTTPDFKKEKEQLEQVSDLIKSLGKPVMKKYRVIKDEKRAKNQNIYSVNSIRDIPECMFFNLPELIALHAEKIYFVEKYEINFRFNKETYGYAWKELESFKTLEEAKEFLKKIKEEENSKPEVVHEEEF